MQEIIISSLHELIKASPYAGIAVLVIWITNHYHFKQSKLHQDILNKSIEEIRKAYSEITDKLPKLYDQVTKTHSGASAAK